MSTVNLIGNSGVQFVDLRANFGDGSPALRVKQNFCELEYDDSVELVFAALAEEGDHYVDATSGEELIDPKTGQRLREDRIETASARRALECFEGFWLPVPYFRRNMSREGGDFEEGPLTWARLIFQPLRQPVEGATHSIVLALDTSYVEQPTDSYATPLRDDLIQSSFGLAADLDASMGFLSEPWVMQWVQSCYEQRKDRLGSGALDESHLPHLAYYATLLQVLNQSTEFPSIRLHDDEYHMDVDLILDVGNSRSCGILVQSEGDEPVTFNVNSARLRIRDLSIPDVIHEDAFPMRVEFIKAAFGPEEATSISDRPNAFDWPSPVRIGYEAIRRSVISGRPEYPSGMSSPKRYLWDDEPRDRDEAWRFNDGVAEVPKPALNQFTTQFTQEGIYLGEDETGARTPALTPCFSRGSTMTFVFAELLLHAISQINSPSFREHHGKETRRRRLNRIVVTCPTNMLEKEKQELRRHAWRAADALRNHFNGRPPFDGEITVIPEPDEVTKPLERRQEWDYDEATCCQMVFVYGEVLSRFNGDMNRFARTYGKPRGGSSEPSVRIASVDIGGGTTDVMVCTYEHETAVANAMVKPRPEFWEGFSLAGDDIAKRVIERCVLPPIAERARELGCHDQTMAMSTLFGEDFGGQSASERQHRRAFANQVAMPIALAMIRHAVERRPMESRPYRWFFENHPAPQPGVEAYVEEKMRSMGAEGFRLADVQWTLDYREVEWAVQQVMQRRIVALCNILAQFDCDLLLLAGQPTMLPIVRDLFVSCLPVTPDRIINLGRYRIGNWYPFSDARGTIKDPKTCVSAGAAVALMAGTSGRLEGFRLDTSELREGIYSTAAYVGTFDTQQLILKDQLLTPHDGGDEGTLAFSGDIFLGFRQLPTDSWIAAPMYRLAFAPNEAERLRNRIPLQVTLRRPSDRPERREVLRVAGVEDREGQSVSTGSLVLKPQSMVTEGGHWQDTGTFFVAKFQ
ncbi:virulence factor SrfB [Halorhodospira abdelmalekii]|uniref:virulence factor SrfB n=1 Tax=Halorhodospira abdelmalekii TaxID=421629 RepID=UPI0019031F4B